MSVATDTTNGWFLDETVPAPPGLPRGRTRIAPRALRQVVSMVTAESLSVPFGQVGVQLGDDHGMLALTISTSIRVVSLSRVTREPAVIARTGGTILTRSAQSQTEIRHRVTELTGTTIGQVTIRLTGIDVQQERRVR